VRKISWKAKLVIATVVLLSVGGVAYGYWTQTGSGSGSAETGAGEAITINQTSDINGLAPGVAPKTLSGNFDNPNDGPQYVGSVTATVTGTDKGDDCDATNYAIAGTAPVNAEIPNGDGVGSWSGLTIAFVNKPSVNQNACKGATVNISYTSS
jgi:hypothetical protein